jgi:hypothetical protein
MCGMSAVPSPGLLAAVRSRSGGPVGRGGECPAAHNRHPIVSRLPVWSRNRLPPLNPPPSGQPSPIAMGEVARRAGGGRAAMHIQPGIPEYVSRVRGAPAQDRSAPRSSHGRGMRAASGQKDAWDGGGLSRPSRPSRRRIAFPCNAPPNISARRQNCPAPWMCAPANAPFVGTIE